MDAGVIAVQREALDATGQPYAITERVVLAVHHIVGHPAIEPGLRLRPQEGLVSLIFPEVAAQLGGEPIGGGIRITGIAKASATGGLQVGADHHVEPSLATQDLIETIQHHVAPADDGRLGLDGMPLVAYLGRCLVPFLEDP